MERVGKIKSAIRLTLRHHDGRAGLPDQLEKILTTSTSARRKARSADRRRARSSRRRSGERLLRQADRLHRSQQDAHLPGGDLRSGAFGDEVQDLEEAIEIGNDTVYGLGAGVWSRNGTTAYRVGREIKAGRVWTNCYHLYPAEAAFGGYKQSGFGRETHKLRSSTISRRRICW